ncbi:MAG: hypothetical protein KDA78_01270 [Planctomycetaceae bacterium]|nr:hypothetical protein [Planctomycetaceae bacterium]
MRPFQKGWQAVLWAVCATVILLPQTLTAQPKLESLFGNNLDLKPDAAAKAEPQLNIRFSPDSAAAGAEVTLQIEIVLDKSAYVYSQNPNIGAETKIQLTEVVGLEPVEAAFVPNKDPKVVAEPLFDNAKLEKFYGGVTWSRKFRVKGDVAPQVNGEIRFQVCDDATCQLFNKPIALKMDLATEPARSLVDMLEDKKTEMPPHMPVVDTTIAPAPGSPPATGTVVASKTITPEREVGGADPITFEISLLNQTEGNGPVKDLLVVIHAKVEGDWHIYAQTQDPEMFGLPTVINFDSVAGLTPVDTSFIPTTKPEVVDAGDGIIQQVFHHEVTWQRRYQLDTAAFQGRLGGSIRYQLCQAEGSCLPPNDLEFELMSATGDQMAQAGNETAKPKVETTIPADSPIEEEIALQEQGLIPFLLTGILFGYAALLTPCVFPMIPITVSFFLKQAEKEHHKPFGMALLYCLGIVATFTFIGIVISAVFGAAGPTILANNEWFNLFLAAVLVFFGLNLLGLFEIRVPSSLLSWSSSHERQGGVIGVLFMAFTFTLVSFTCTFAFVGLLLPMAAQGEYYWPALGMIAFSSAFASPFFFLALFPSYLKKLPKSGGWMNNVKVVFGLLEIGAAFKFLSVADISVFSAPYIFDYTIVMIAWMVLSLVAGLYLLGLFRLPHDTATDSIGVIRLGIAIVFLWFGFYLSTGIYGDKAPEGPLWDQIAAFAPPTFETEDSQNLGPTLKHDDLLYAVDVDRAIEFASDKNQPLFFDFTGTNCINCRLMEGKVFPIKENHELLKQFVRVQLYTDTIPLMADEQATPLLEKNRKLQAEWFNDATLPAYAIVSADGQTILSSYKGAERTPGQFTRFLKAGLEAWQNQSASGSSPTRR